ncbi:MAG: sugar transferase [Capsulimonadaceae bacterium]
MNPKQEIALIRRIDRAVKRTFDLIVTPICVAILLPVYLIVAIAVATTSRGPLLYKQKRVGRDGRLFEIFKFRSMYHGADRNGPAVTAADDSRITPVGRWLRKTKLDEIPQLFNVIRGDMSLVGPRPQVPQFVEHFDPELRDVVLGVRPGVTGPTAILFRNEEQLLANRPDRETYYIRTILPIKLEMDVEYVRTVSLRNDVRILLQTGQVLIDSAVRKGRSVASECEDPVAARL